MVQTKISMITAMPTSGCTRGITELGINTLQSQLNLHLDGYACTFLDLVLRTWRKGEINSRYSQMRGESCLFFSSALTLPIVSAVDREFCAFLKSNALLLLFLRPDTAYKNGKLIAQINLNTENAHME